MQTITTKILPATNTKPARVKATHEGNALSATIPRGNGAIEKDYNQAARILKTRLKWPGKMVGGHTRDGMVFVFIHGEYIIE